MHWFTLALITAVSVALRDVSVKSYRDLTPLEAAAVELAWALPFFVLGLFLIPVPPIENGFWLPFIISIPLNIIPYFLYLYAIKISPISLTVPFLSFTPLFMIITGQWTLGESVSAIGIAGIVCIVTGSYVLNFSHVSKGVFEPVKALSYEKGSWFMLLVAFIYAFASVIGKKAILHSSALFFSYSFFMVFSVLTLIFLLVFKKVSIRRLFHNKKRGIWLGSLMMTHVSTHCMAIAISTAAYMIAVKRSSILISVLLGYLIFKEGDMRNRMLGTLLMFGGLVLIIFTQ